MSIISRAWQWLFPEWSFAIELHTDVSTAIRAVRARLDTRFFNPFHTGFVGRANERVVKVRYQRAWQGNSSAPVFVGRFQSEHGRSYLVGHCRAPISTRISVGFWLGFVTLWWILALIATLTQPEPGIPFPLLLTVPPLMLAFGVGMCRLGLRLARGDAEEIQSMLQSALAPELPGVQ